MKYLKYIVLFVMASLFSVFTIAKPTKIVYPQVAGVTCVETWLCIDNLDRINEARTLYDNALQSLEVKLSQFVNRPKVVFCSTQACFADFGFKKPAAASIAGFGVVVAPRGWTQYYVEHEMIHQWQSENFGFINVLMAPEWLKEGMAYSVSDDPREQLDEPFQSFRQEYEKQFHQLRGMQLKAALEEAF